MDGISPFEPCPPSDARFSGSWLHTVNWTESFNQMVSEVCVIMALRQNFALAICLVVFANSLTETCWESCVIKFPTTPPCSTRVDVFETGNVPILLSLS